MSSGSNDGARKSRSRKIILNEEFSPVGLTLLNRISFTAISMN
jgi:hypothetical protein